MPPSLGQRLRHARESRGWTLEDVAHNTRIPAQRLHDLEEDRYTASGSLTYAKSFLSSYAKLLGVDASSVLDQIQPPPLGGVRDYRYLVENHGQWVDDDSAAPAMAPEQTRGPAAKSFGIAAIVSIFAVALGFTVWNSFASNSAKSSARNETASEARAKESMVAAATGEGAKSDSRSSLPEKRAQAVDGTGEIPLDEGEAFEVRAVEIGSQPAMLAPAAPLGDKPIPRAVPVR